MCKLSVLYFLCFKQKTAYEMRISDWSSDVCSSDLAHRHIAAGGILDGRIFRVAAGDARAGRGHQLARVRPDPFHPVRPPTPLGFAGLFDELVQRRRFSVECPILVFSGRRRIDDASDMARSETGGTSRRDSVCKDG